MLWKVNSKFWRASRFGVKGDEERFAEESPRKRKDTIGNKEEKSELDGPYSKKKMSTAGIVEGNWGSRRRRILLLDDLKEKKDVSKRKRSKEVIFKEGRISQ